LLQKLKACQVHAAIETCGFFDYSLFAQKILPFVDLILYDVKLMDPGESARYLGQPNDRILENLGALLADGRTEVWPRVPLVPGITDTPANLSAIVDRLCELGAGTVRVLPYNPLGLAGYSHLGWPLPDLPAGFTNLERETGVIESLRSIIAAREKGTR